MMRICLIVIGLAVLIIMELGTPSRSKPSEPDRFEQLTIDVSASGDTLKKGDRLEVHRLQQEVPALPMTSAEPVSPSPPDLLAIKMAEEDSSAVGRGTNDKKDIVKTPKPRPKQNATPNKPLPKLANSRLANSEKTPKTERPKAVVEIKPCRPNAFDDFLQALSLPSRCQT
jgi:hypothetical protein